MNDEIKKYIDSITGLRITVDPNLPSDYWGHMRPDLQGGYYVSEELYERLQNELGDGR